MAAEIPFDNSALGFRGGAFASNGSLHYCGNQLARLLAVVIGRCSALLIKCGLP